MAEHKTLTEALAAFQAVVPRMSKDETAKVKSDKANYTYGYAGLDQFVEIVEPVLGEHGMAVTSKTTFVEGLFMLEVSLVHESGQRETAFWPLPDPRRVGPQDIGSAMTYGRRYLGWGLTGTFPGGVDDDGAQAQASARDSWEDAKPAKQQAAQQQAAPEQTSWTDQDVANYQARLKTMNAESASVAYDWMAQRNLHERPVGASGLTATTVFAVHLSDEALAPTTTLEDLTLIKDAAEARGLLNVKVTERETLAEVLFEAHELAVHAIVEQAKADTPDPDTLRAE